MWGPSRLTLVIATAVCCAAPPLLGQEKATIAVLPFEFAVATGTGEVETSILTDALARALVNSRKFTVLDRARLKRVRKEQRFGASGLVDAGSRARVGRLLGAQYLVVGTIRDVAVGPPRAMAYGSGWTRPVSISSEIEVVDAASGQIVAARRASGSGQARASGPTDVDSVARQGIEQAANQLAQEALQGILDAAFPVKVLEVSGSEVRLNRGEEGGLEVGTVLRCFATGQALRDPDTKEVLGTSESPAGSVAVTDVLAKLSVARIVDDSGMRPGNVCRVDTAAEEATGTHRAPPPTGAIYSY